LNEGVVEHQGLRFAYHGTAYGDGCYTDQHFNEYGVDAGIIGCIPLEALEGKVPEGRLESLGHIHEFKYDFTSEYYEGTISFGDIEIQTGDTEDEED
jgi:hypothetical protein